MLLLLTICRVIFWIFHADRFTDASILFLFYGLRFDLASLLLVFIPYHLFVIAGIWVNHKAVFSLQRLFFLSGATVSLALNCIDMAYFRFTLKRSTADLLQLSTYNQDIITLLPHFFRDYYLIVFIFIGLLAFLIAIDFRALQSAHQYSYKSGLQQSLKRTSLSIFLILALIIAGRGGWQYSPLNIMDAAKIAGPQYAPLVLNSTYSFFRTIGQSTIESLHFFESKETTKYYSPAHIPSGGDFAPLNIVVIIMESFGKEFTDEPMLTPNFNRIKRQSLYFDRCYANGKKSIDALPAVLSGIPSLMESPFISSPYATNNIEGLGSLLAGKGYHTSFFHGGMNGTMNFDGYCKAAGIENYYGRMEFGLDQDYDGAWGIYDGPFFNYWRNELYRFKEPFFSCFFSLSSHHPYGVPKKLKKQIERPQRSPLEISVAYADQCLGSFLESIKNAPFFNRTLFVITADHTPDSRDDCYSGTIGQMAVPLLFYMPGKIIPNTDNRHVQHLDIMPSILDFVNYPDTVFSFGVSLFRPQPSFSVSYNNGSFLWLSDTVHIQWIKDSKPIFGNPEDTCGFSGEDFITDRGDLEWNKMRAFIQTYNNAIISNRLIWGK